MHGVGNYHRDHVDVIFVTYVGDGHNSNIFQTMNGSHCLENDSS